MQPQPVDAVPERRGLTLGARRRRVLFRLLHGVQDHATSGLLRVSCGGREVGSVAVSHGRVCLAMLSGDGPLTPAPPLVSELARRARDQGRGFGETVLTRPSADVERARDELRDATVHALVGMAEDCLGDDPEFTLIPVRGDYDARLTFGALELFTGVMWLLTGPPGDVGHALFDALRGTTDGGLLLRLDLEAQALPPFPVAAFGQADFELRDAISLARLASEAVRPHPRPGGDVTPTWVSLRVGERSFVCVPGATSLALMHCAGSEQAAAVVAHAMFYARAVGPQPAPLASAPGPALLAPPPL